MGRHARVKLRAIGDRHYRIWKWFRRGNYAANGVLFSLAMRSDPRLAETDLHCFALLADFRGYYRGYAERLRRTDYLSWVILKAYAANRAGTVRLRAPTPTCPLISAPARFRARAPRPTLPPSCRRSAPSAA